MQNIQKVQKMQKVQEMKKCKKLKKKINHRRKNAKTLRKKYEKV